MFEGRTVLSDAQDIRPSCCERSQAIGWPGMKTVQYFPAKKIPRTVIFGMGRETTNIVTGSPSFPSFSFFSNMKYKRIVSAASENTYRFFLFFFNNPFDFEIIPLENYQTLKNWKDKNQ